jgi:hypothetical protein
VAELRFQFTEPNPHHYFSVTFQFIPPVALLLDSPMLRVWRADN